MEFRESSWTKSVAISCLLPITGGEYKSKDWESRNSNVKIKNEKILRPCSKVYNDIYTYTFVCCFFSIKEEKSWIHGSQKHPVLSEDHACSMWYPLWWFSRHLGESRGSQAAWPIRWCNPIPEGPGTQPSMPWRFGCRGYDLMSRKFFTHATPTLFNAGTPKPQMSSCFLLTMKDDLGRHGNVSGRSDWHVLDDDLCDVDRKIASKASMRPWNSVQLGCRSSSPSRTGEFFPRMYRWFGYIIMDLASNIAKSFNSFITPHSSKSFEELHKWKPSSSFCCWTNKIQWRNLSIIGLAMCIPKFTEVINNRRKFK